MFDTLKKEWIFCLTCNKPYLVSTSYNLYSLISVGTGLGRLSHWPRTLAKLANTGSVQNARQSLSERESERECVSVCVYERERSRAEHHVWFEYIEMNISYSAFLHHLCIIHELFSAASLWMKYYTPSAVNMIGAGGPWAEGLINTERVSSATHLLF